MNLFSEETVKILPLWQPWASAVVWGEKRIETRSWEIPFRGIVAIHATKSTPSADLFIAGTSLDFRNILSKRQLSSFKELPHGAILGSIDLIDIRSVEELVDRPYRFGLSDQEIAFGDWSAGRFGWLLQNPVKLKEPIPFKGQQGMWNAPDEIRQQILDSRKEANV